MMNIIEDSLLTFCGPNVRTLSVVLSASFEVSGVMTTLSRSDTYHCATSMGMWKNSCLAYAAAAAAA